MRSHVRCLRWYENHVAERSLKQEAGLVNMYEYAIPSFRRLQSIFARSLRNQPLDNTVRNIFYSFKYGTKKFFHLTADQYSVKIEHIFHTGSFSLVRLREVTWPTQMVARHHHESTTRRSPCESGVRVLYFSFRAARNEVLIPAGYRLLCSTYQIATHLSFY
jgi:hypothetical protein